VTCRAFRGAREFRAQLAVMTLTGAGTPGAGRCRGSGQDRSQAGCPVMSTLFIIMQLQDAVFSEAGPRLVFP